MNSGNLFYDALADEINRVTAKHNLDWNEYGVTNYIDNQLLRILDKIGVLNMDQEDLKILLSKYLSLVESTSGDGYFIPNSGFYEFKISKIVRDQMFSGLKNNLF
jgi:hypothetical protein